MQASIDDSYPTLIEGGLLILHHDVVDVYFASLVVPEKGDTNRVEC